MSQIISALFDSRDEAEAVVSHLRVHDRVVPEKIQAHALKNAQPVEEDGILASMVRMLEGSPDRGRLSEGYRRGGTVVTAEVDDSIAEHVLAVFNRHGAVDLDQRAAGWREEGWQDDPEAASAANLPVNASLAVGAATMAGTGVPMVDLENPVTGPGSGLTR